MTGEPAPPDPRIGQLIDGRYRVEAVIGKGGMGAVYRAVHVGLERHVAIKFLRADQRDADAVARFHREAKTASRVDHVNVVDVHDAGTTDLGDDFIVMELLDGESLDSVLRRGAVATGHAIDIARQMLRGLHAIHSAGIIHRDVKPGNVVLTRRDGDEVVKLTDFGIAKTAERGHAITEAGKIVGTVQYMAPEQLLGDPVDHRADIYAVGITLYALVAGDVPFRGESFTRIAMARLTEAVPALGDVVPGASAALASAVMCALAERREDRYPDALAFERALAQIATAAAPSTVSPDAETEVDRRPSMQGSEVATARVERTAVKQEGPAGAPGSRQPRRWVLVVGGVALAGVGLVIALGGWSRDARRLSPEQPVAASRDVIDHLAEARAAERRGDLVAGIAAYEAAQHVAPRAENLYRIGELEEQRGNAQAAAHAFARYLEASPGAADRDIVLTRIARLTPSPTSDAGVPIVRRRTTQPTKQRCRCQPTDGQHWRAKGVNLGEVHVCPTKASSIQCRCNTGLVGPGGTNLCVGGLVECADCDHGARTCKDPRCEPNGWGCAEVDYRSFHLPGRTGDTCRGFEIQAKPVETDGVLECRVCPAAKHPRNAEYLGEAGERCRGWDREHEIERVGVLDQCAAD